MAEVVTVNNTSITKDAENKTLILERVFNASRDRVWQAWTDPEQFKQWWGPRGWQTEMKEADFKVGGNWHYGMKCVDENQGEWYGQTSWGKMTFTAIDEPNSFAYKDFFSDEAGNENREMPVTVITVEFIEEDGKTRIRSSGTYDTSEDYEKVVAMGMIEGASETWDRLEELVSKA